MREHLTAIQCAIGHNNLLWVLGCEVGGGELNHFACADKEHLGLGEISENPLGQFHRCCGH